jgi:hypothetical protein
MNAPVWVGIGVICVGIFHLISAYYPRWDVRWGSRGYGRDWEKRPPVSIHGRLAFGIVTICFGASFLAFEINALVGRIAEGITVLAFIGLIITYRRDRSRHINDEDKRSGINL